MRGRIYLVFFYNATNTQNSIDNKKERDVITTVGARWWSFSSFLLTTYRTSFDLGPCDLCVKLTTRGDTGRAGGILSKIAMRLDRNALGFRILN